MVRKCEKSGKKEKNEGENKKYNRKIKDQIRENKKVTRKRKSNKEKEEVLGWQGLRTDQYSLKIGVMAILHE